MSATWTRRSQISDEEKKSIPLLAFGACGEWRPLKDLQVPDNDTA